MMNKRSTIVAMGCALLLSTVLGTYVNAWGYGSPNHLTFSGPVGLPGVTLGSGTYTFERVSSTDPQLIAVRNRTTSQVYYLGFTLPVRRPAGLKEDHQIVFKESAKGVAPRIDAWYPVGESAGAQFMYSDGR